MPKIVKIRGREILDSRGNPTVAAIVLLDDEVAAEAMVPSGASTGSKEAVELRDKNAKRFGGKGVLKAIDKINTEIADEIEGEEVDEQNKIDEKMIKLDGTKNKSRLGANAILAVSIAAARAAAKSREVNLFQHFANLTGRGFAQILPLPFFNVINGGAHADSGLEIQEFMLVPVGAETFSEALQIGAEVFHALKKMLAEKKLSTAVGDEGGFAPRLKKNSDAIEIILSAAESVGHLKKVKIALDVAASEFYDSESGKYNFENSGKSAADLISYFEKLANDFPICSIEDPLDENDAENWPEITKKLGKKLQIVGDDFLVTNPNLIQNAIDEKAANALLVKMNQIGTLTETFAAVKMAQSANWATMISHRSGETEDTTIADLAVGLSAGEIKTGSLCRSERICKFNRLLEIEEVLAGKAEFAASNLNL